ncbi:sigma factor-like helix-turn-helix DNA-binding protein [Halobacillus sp. HZG1]|uniref:sigma factor-like helix-turn-helix DNA-binding protein n=1 Tax=Halobacillus sp. HZG1 TaxID=3111769 RepID=UPI002DBCF76D|nr:sigma factor-like helix-turn-helix DNA-binding protein [Halobacillus sp. HZG1]MEC3884229.1 sigma factor-like helix-turn-helix DNA-binding protein [Halobacillus sp. HZG1]
MELDTSQLNWKLWLEDIEENYEKLLRYCHFLTGDGWDGKDLAQESVARAYEHYDADDIQPALLKKIAYHVWVDQKRKEKMVPLVKSASADCVIKEETVDETLVQLLLEKLTVKQMLTFILKVAFHYKISEIAELLQMKETGVKALLKRSRDNLSRCAEVERLQIMRTRSEDDLLYQTLVRTLTIQDPAVLIEKIPILLKPASRNQLPASPLNDLSLAA